MPRASTSLTMGRFTDYGDYSMRTVFTSYKMGNIDGLGTSPARVEVRPGTSGQALHRSSVLKGAVRPS